MSSDEARTESTLPEACASARKLMRAFVENDIGRGENARLRVHLKSCARCHAEYVELVDSVARIHGQLRAIRELESAELDSAGEARIPPQDDAEPVRPRSFLARGRARTGGSPFRGFRGGGIVVALAAFAVLIAVCWPEQPVRSLTARSTGGRISVGNGAQVDAGEQIEWVRGQWCDVRPGARAELSAPHGEISVEGPALVLLESPDPVRVRLQKGELRIRGEVTVTHEHAVAELSGPRARASVIGTLLEVACADGRAVIRTANGATEIATGQAARISPDGSIAVDRAAPR